ncbi:sulfatase-like hydrolase/transferase [Advenella kashmirensis]
MDHQIGNILNALADSGMADNTTVIYSSDHGDNMGERGLWNKCMLYRDSTSIPMILKGPDVPVGQTVQTNVSLVDIFPTILQSVGVAPTEPDSDLPGLSLVDSANKPYDPARLAFSEYHAVGSESAGYMLADSRYKYHHYVGYEPELFDLENDPLETHDLAHNSKYADVVESMQKRLFSVIDPIEVDAQAKSDQHELIQKFGGRDAALGIGTPGATPVPSS